MPNCVLGLGSNLGDRRRQLLDAFAAIDRLPDTRLIARSDLYETTPVGGPGDQPVFLNAAAYVSTDSTAEGLLSDLNQIESEMGRERREKWSARTLDIDILVYGQLIIRSERLVLPHSGMEYRRFALEPAKDVAPWMQHPTSQWTIGNLFRHLNQAADRVAIAASDAATRDRLIEGIVDTLCLPKRSFSDVTSCDGVSGRVSPVVSAWHALGGAQTLDPTGIGGTESRCRDRPKLILGLVSSEMLGDDESLDRACTASKRRIGRRSMGATAGERVAEWRKILGLPQTGPIAWIDSSDPAAALRTALAAIQAVWPALA